MGLIDSRTHFAGICISCVLFCGIVSFFFFFPGLCLFISLENQFHVVPPSAGWCSSCWLLVAGDDTVHHFSKKQPGVQRAAQLQCTGTAHHFPSTLALFCNTNICGEKKSAFDFCRPSQYNTGNIKFI